MAKSPFASSARCATSGVGSVAVYSDPDRIAQHPRYADEALALGGDTSAESYLVVEKLLAAAERIGRGRRPSRVRLSRRERRVRPRGRGRRARLDRPAARRDRADGLEDARAAGDAGGGRADHPGTTDPVGSAAEVVALGEEIGYPLLIKAAAGGGGKGMKVVDSADEAAQAFESAQREGLSYFADASVYVEKYLEDPRHVEVQVLADAHGNVVHLGERDCTIQRRHQKLVEETPSPAVSPELRERIGQIAVDAARAAGYRSAGTIEGLLAPDGSYYFMEMNTRVQVEHTITELVSGIDIVRAQIQIAARRAPAVRAGRDQAARATRSSAGSTPRIRHAASSRRPGRSPPTASPRGRACASTRASRPAR